MTQLQDANDMGRTFDVDVCLGRGGFGEVYRARMKQPGGLTTTVALKVLLAGVDPTSQPVERLRDEGRLLAALEHPVIMRAIDITVLDGRVALVAEYIDGQDLTECCRGEDPVSQRGLAHVIGEVASALDKAWSTQADNGEPMRLVHRDIKPSNIRIGRHGEVKLLDFGIARSDEVVREAKTAAQMVVGSLQYMAPERFSDRPLGPEADVFALGCCLFEGLSGQLLFARIDPARALRLALDPEQYTKHLYRRRRALRKDTDIGIIALMEHCLAYAPEDRPTAAELVECCDVLSGELPGQTPRLPPSLQRIGDLNLRYRRQISRIGCRCRRPPTRCRRVAILTVEWRWWECCCCCWRAWPPSVVPWRWAARCTSVVLKRLRKGLSTSLWRPLPAKTLPSTRHRDPSNLHRKNPVLPYVSGLESFRWLPPRRPLEPPRKTRPPPFLRRQAGTHPDPPPSSSAVWERVGSTASSG